MERQDGTRGAVSDGRPRDRDLPGSSVPHGSWCSRRSPKSGTCSRWWGPEGFTHHHAAFEFPSAGSGDFVMHGPDGTDYQEWISWTEIAPSERIALCTVSPAATRTPHRAVLSRDTRRRSRMTGSPALARRGRSGRPRDSPCSSAIRSDGAISVQEITPGSPSLRSVHHEVPLPADAELERPRGGGEPLRSPPSDRCRTSVNASNTSSRGALMTREITISRSGRR